MTLEEFVDEFRTLRADYVPDLDPMTRDEIDRASRLKEIIDTLPTVDRAFLIHYVECQSYRELGRRTGLSHMTCYKEVARIKRRVLEEYKRRKKK